MRSKVCHLLLFTYLRGGHLLYWLERQSAFAGTPPSGVHPRPSVEGEEGGREEPQSITQQSTRPKEGGENFNSSLGPISLEKQYSLKIKCLWYTVIKEILIYN